MGNRQNILSLCAKAVILTVVSITAVVGLFVVFQWASGTFLITQMSSSSGCADTVVVSAQSPDGLHSAIVYERNCGATTDFSTIITVGNASRKVTPDNDDHIVFVAKGQPQMRLQWKTNNILIVHSPNGVPLPANDVFRQKLAWNDIQVFYR